MKRNIRKVNKFILFCMGLFIMLPSCAPAPVETPTLTPSATRKVTPTRTVTPTWTVTPTAIPTLPLEDALARIAELEESNGGCEYPCFWDITPGVTTWDQALSILAPITTYIYTNSDWDQRQDYSIRLVSSGQDISGLGVIVHENIVERVDHWEYLPISAILQEYGQPETVYYFSTGVSDGGNPVFVLVLSYPTQGILINIMDNEHGQYILRDDGGHIQICAPVIGLSGEEITLYDPNDTQLQATILEDVTSISSYLHDLSMELDMSMEEFHQTFSNPNSQACLIDPEPFPPEWVEW